MSQQPGDDDETRHRTNMIVLGIAIAIVALGVVLMWLYKRETDLQNCLWANHRNCDTVSGPER